MTESVFLFTATLALWAMARALVRPTGYRQLVVIATCLLATSVRLQGVVLLPVLLTAIGLMALFGRNIRLLRRFTPTLIAIAGFGLVVLSFELVASGSVGSPLGAYGVTVSKGYDLQAAASWVFRHAGDLFLVVVGIPLIAMLLLAYEAMRGRERDPEVQALAAVALSASAWFTLQVGVFASRFVGHLAERNLVALAPPLLVCFVVWLSRGMPRPQPATSIIAVAAAIPAILLPVRTLAAPVASPDAFMTIPLWRLLDATSPRDLEAFWVGAVVVIVALTLWVPRRARPVVGGARRSRVRAHLRPHGERDQRARAFGPLGVFWDRFPVMGKRGSSIRARRLSL